ncbi:MAG: hypothetical protein BGO51_24375 [Rhodospirillales bacterium 69-11]|jgi:hypothetical protein|nr:hypothetical protein [Rhodospirillales bacterium]MBN8905116.1 hypothetical protein [Rhodospirillales bacterium]MBN8925674.1 hypothetical protein [Rhodospirillales bacterium]OJW33047.1 MAG: hypothetical protein BGO51_24375 [Rhodospirillales bacterium 69-11]
MPYRNGIYQLPEHPITIVPDPMGTAYSRLKIYFWNILAFRHDGEMQQAAEWEAKAREAARALGCWMDEHERVAAVSAAASSAKKDFARDLAEEGTVINLPRWLWDGEQPPIREWRSQKGVEPMFR